jgi:hypothetical protein
MNVADMATIHSFNNTCDVNGLGRKKGASEINSPNKRMPLTGPAFLLSAIKRRYSRPGN